MAQVASSSKLPLEPSHRDLVLRNIHLAGDVTRLPAVMQAASSSRSPAEVASGSYYSSAATAHSSSPASASLRPPDQQQMPTTAASLMREGPRDFTVIKDVGDGSFGTVCLADWKSPLPSGTMLSPMQHPTTRPEYIGKRLVAIKKMKKPFPSWQECMKLKELKSLLTIPPHPNLIPLYDAFLMPTTKELHFVFECMEGNLYQLTKSRKGRPLAAGLVSSIYEQIVLGLDHIHEHGYFHRDMKPENLLITTTGLADYPNLQPGLAPERDVLVIVKLADFGLARETLSKPPYTEYVSTRWYRAPEVLLRSRDYSNPVDMWALGTILAELVNLKPLFPGHSEVDQVLQICDVLGDPSHSYGHDSRNRRNGGGPWDRGIRMARAVGFTFPIRKPVKFARLFSDRVPHNLIDCIEDLLRYEPKARLTSKDCIQHDYMRLDAPRLRPPQAKPLVSATAPLRPQQATPRQLPPSHSTPHSSNADRPPFGAAESNLKPLAMLRQLDGSPIVKVNGGQPSPNLVGASGANPAGGATPASPMQEDAAEVQWAPHVATSSRIVSVSGYPAFPDSASLYAASASTHHDGSVSQAPSSDATMVLSNGQVTDSTLKHGDPRHTQALQAHQYEQYQRQYRQDASSSQSGGYDAHAAAAYDREAALRAAAFVPFAGAYPASAMQGQLPAAASSGELSQQNDANASNETIGSRDKERRRSKGWGLNISKFASSGSSGTLAGSGSGGATNSNGAHQYAVGSPVTGRMPPNGMASSNVLSNGPMQASKLPLEPTPAQRIAAEHSNAPSGILPNGVPAKPVDSKKAKKEAEKAAREAEKAKREAQQKAARDRARAVMQKRNQLLSSSNSKDAVEWLSGGSLQAEEQYRSSPSEKARGKQPANPGSQLSPSMPGFASGEFPRSPLQQPMHGLSPDYGMNANPAIASSMAWRGGGAGRYSRSTKARRREHDDDHSMSSFEDAVDPRRVSMQSYQTGDSDPGPGTGQQAPQGHYVQRASSSSSLASAPSLIDQRRFAPSLESHRSSAETRSISSLDHQLITNMERMTAAEARARTPGNVSPGPAHVVGARQSVSRQSRTNSRASSTSAHRQGSASPLHHASGIPRFHPYSHGGPVTPSTGYHLNYQLPPLHQSLAQPGGPPRNETGGDASAPAAFSPHAGHAQQHVQQHHINPIFHVAAGNGGHATTLPPFSSIAATIDVPAIDEKATQMLYAQTRPTGPMQQS